MIDFVEGSFVKVMLVLKVIVCLVASNPALTAMTETVYSQMIGVGDRLSPAYGVTPYKLTSVGLVQRLGVLTHAWDLGTFTNHGTVMWTGDSKENGTLMIRDGLAHPNPIVVSDVPDSDPFAPTKARIIPTGSMDSATGRSFLFASNPHYFWSSQGILHGSYVTAQSAVFDVTDPQKPLYVGLLPGSQASATEDPETRLIFVVGDVVSPQDGMTVERHLWVSHSEVTADGSNGWLRDGFTDLGILSRGGDRENQLSALPDGRFLFLAMDSRPGQGVQATIVDSPIRLLNERQDRRDFVVHNTILSPANDYVDPHDPTRLMQVYGPEFQKVETESDGSLTVYFSVSQWITSPSPLDPFLPYGPNVDLTDVVNQPYRVFSYRLSLPAVRS